MIPGLSVLYLSRKALQQVHGVLIGEGGYHFQSSTYRGRHCNRNVHDAKWRSRSLSVLYLSRKALQRRDVVAFRARLPSLSVLYLSRKALQLACVPARAPEPWQLSVLYLSRKALQRGERRAGSGGRARAFSPLLIEEGTATDDKPEPHGCPPSFQSSTYRGRHCNCRSITTDSKPPRLSVLYLSRKALQPTPRVRF